MREPIHRSRPVAPEPAMFGRCQRVHERAVMSEGNSNVYLLETGDTNVQINSGMGFEAPVHEHNLDTFSPAPVSHLIATQGHVDHVGGVGYFRRQHPGLLFVATDGNAEHQAYDARLARFRARRSSFAFADRFGAVFEHYAEHGYTELEAQDTPTPDVTFADRLELTVGDLELVLIACPGAETDDSLVVWLPQHRICATGNLFGCPFGHFPNLSTIRGDRYRDALVCADAAQTVLDLEPELILYGHHDPIEGAEVIEAELVAYRDAIHDVHDRTVEGMNDGRSVYELMREITLPPHLEVGEGYGKVSWGVRAIWEHYSGWFHHRSTTELLGVPRSAVDDELVELAGADALVGRAEQRLSAGEVAEAIHLLDIVLAVDPEHTDARTVAVAAHEALLADADNMWLQRWLEHQITRLRGERTGRLDLR